MVRMDCLSIVAVKIVAETILDILRMVEGLWKGGSSGPVPQLTTAENAVVACILGRILGLDIHLTSDGTDLPARSASKGPPARSASKGIPARSASEGSSSRTPTSQNSEEPRETCKPEPHGSNVPDPSAKQGQEIPGLRVGLAGPCSRFGLVNPSLRFGLVFPCSRFGLVSEELLIAQYRWNALGADTRVYGVIGCPVAHSMSPAIHNAAFTETHYNGVYLPLRVEPDYASFKAFVDFCIARTWMNLRGCSVTIPHKENLLRYVRERGGFIEPLARRIGVANTLCIEPGRKSDGSDARLSAYNTDYRGALDALCTGMNIQPAELKNLSVAVLGAGGVSRAIVAGLRDGGAKVTIYNRTQEKADSLAAEFGATSLPNDQRAKNTADAIINCTSIGMWPEVDATPLPKEGLAHRPAVFDTVYNPVETRLLREARAAGCRTIDGVAMFVNQAVGQFERWTEQKAPVQIMRHIVLEQLSKPR